MPGAERVLALDGPSGSGKGTVGQLCAQSLGWHYLDSGAVYRGLALAVDRSGVAPDDLDGVVDVAKNMRFECRPAPPGPAEIRIDGREVGDILRTEAMGERASRLAGHGRIREALLGLQRRALRKPGLVADGRDIGTVVFPRAMLKVYLTASPEVRARRRYNQLKLKGFDVNLAPLFQAIQDRDARDSQRAVSPLTPADDAVIVDTSDLDIDEVVSRVLDHVQTRLDPAGE